MTITTVAILVLIITAVGIVIRSVHYINKFKLNVKCTGVYVGLEWAVMSVSIAAFISNTVLLVLTSMAVCCGGQKKSTAISLKQSAAATYQQQPTIYFQQQGQDLNKQPMGYYLVSPGSAAVLQQQQQPLNVQQLMIPAPVHQPIQSSVLVSSTTIPTPTPETLIKE
jgi:hypothetical protein